MFLSAVRENMRINLNVQPYLVEQKYIVARQPVTSSLGGINVQDDFGNPNIFNCHFKPNN